MGTEVQVGTEIVSLFELTLVPLLSENLYFFFLEYLGEISCVCRYRSQSATCHTSQSPTLSSICWLLPVASVSLVFTLPVKSKIFNWIPSLESARVNETPFLRASRRDLNRIATWRTVYIFGCLSSANVIHPNVSVLQSHVNNTLMKYRYLDGLHVVN